uniref:Uncharacterized protein n=1 Tax=Sinocyclocheilus anshuiensis TaxID=1608454 RepID=A0A671L9U3_9TELE
MNTGGEESLFHGNLCSLMAVLAFGTCGGYTGKNVVSIFCGGGSNETLSATFTYPFRFAKRQCREKNTTKAIS